MTVENVTKNTLLVVDPDNEIGQVMQGALPRYNIILASDGEEAMLQIVERKPSLIVLDLMLPDTDGLILISKIRRDSDSVGIIICSARQGQVDRVLGLKLGADDFIAKPINQDELEARIEAVLRRRNRQQPATQAPPRDDSRMGSLTISDKRGAAIDGITFHMTPTEHRLVLCLVVHSGEIVSRDQLAHEALGAVDEGTGHLVDVHMGRVRKRLALVSGAPRIVTVRGKGFVIEPGKMVDGGTG